MMQLLPFFSKSATVADKLLKSLNSHPTANSSISVVSISVVPLVQI